MKKLFSAILAFCMLISANIAFAGNSTCKGPGFVFSRFSEKKRLGGMGACFLCPVTI